MAKAREYQFEQRPGGRGAVVRIGPTGGRRVINVYENQNAAWDVVNFLNKLKPQEA